MAAQALAEDGGRDGAVPGRRVLRGFVARTVAIEPGPELMGGLVGLMGRQLSAREWVEVAVAWKKLIGFATAGQITAVGELDRALAPDLGAPAGPGQGESVRPAADELAPALRIAPRAASCLVALTRRVEADLPAALDALAEGRMDLTQVKILDQVARDLPAAARGAVQAVAVGRAPRRTAAQLELVKPSV